jgi:hypothetical protein
MSDLSGAQWRKSSRSSNQGQCVEVARNLPGVVGIRDSKDPEGDALAVSPAAWASFLADTKTGSHDR